jgi:hypothetical protein
MLMTFVGGFAEHRPATCCERLGHTGNLVDFQSPTEAVSTTQSSAYRANGSCLTWSDMSVWLASGCRPGTIAIQASNR